MDDFASKKLWMIPECPVFLPLEHCPVSLLGCFVVWGTTAHDLPSAFVHLPLLSLGESSPEMLREDSLPSHPSFQAVFEQQRESTQAAVNC